ncbi:RNA recognition motif domain-containing protein [Mucilaginibacter sp. Mucisp84]|uniref:RNA recognition motif domain-containing protein n=1 Tax=Mucilaginibacter sp. Mucisp84 TaxID=3243058 RepID=UPI0039A59B5B
MKLFINNLPYVFSESDLRTLLEKHCTIIYLKIMMDRKAGQSSGRAFVQVENDVQGRFLIAALNGFKVKGRPMYVSEAHELSRVQAIRKGRSG